MTRAEDRFTLLYELHYDRVERYVRRRVEDSVVRDVVAEVFVVAWRRLGEVPADPLPWLYGTARRVLANEVRAGHRRTQLSDRIAEHTAWALDDPADEVAGRISVASAFARLPEPEAEALRLVAWEDLTLRQAAQSAGCSLPAFTMRVHRAKARLRRELVAGPMTQPFAMKGEPR